MIHDNLNNFINNLEQSSVLASIVDSSYALFCTAQPAEYKVIVHLVFTTIETSLYLQALGHSLIQIQNKPSFHVSKPCYQFFPALI